MWGNTKGWAISGAIVALLALMLFLGSRPPRVSAPTGLLPLGLQSAALKASPASLDIKPGDKDSDGGEMYRQIIDDYKENQFKYENMASEPPAKLEKDPPQTIQWLIDAAECSKGTLFAAKPQEIVNYANRQPSIDALKTAGRLANKLGLYEAVTKKSDKAQQKLKAAFILGQRMYDERLRWDEYTGGTELMTSAVYGLGKIAAAEKNDARADQLAAFTDAVAAYQTSVVRLWQAISTGGGESDQPLSYPGDMFDFAKNSVEPMWQTEATLKLGRMVYMSNVTAGDQRGAKRFLKQAADRTDLKPAVKAAAVSARDLAVEDFRKFGGGS